MEDAELLECENRKTFQEVESAGPPCRPLEFPSPLVARGVRVNALVVHPESGSRQVCSGVVHRENLAGEQEPMPHHQSPGGLSHRHHEQSTLNSIADVQAYWPQRRLQDAIYGSVWACLVLRRHHGVAADDAARAAGVEPGSLNAPIVWEITGEHVAIKMVEWARVHHMRGRILEDPIKEVAAMQLVGNGHRNVLKSTEVLQDADFLYSVMPFCKGGDLFGVVVQYAEESGGEIGMPEPVARFWFRQILAGLQHLRVSGVCHRDLSLENILVHDDTCLLMDFGMCLRVPYCDPDNPGSVTDVTRGSFRRLIKPQGVCGKINYMSPEVYKNNEPMDGYAIDLWAAGVILYIMLTGFPPYNQPSRSDDRFELIITGRLVEQLRNWGIMLSPEAGDLMQRMLQLDPKSRLSMSQVLSHSWVVNGPVEPPPAAEPLPYR